MTPTHQKSASFPSTTSDPEMFSQDMLWEKYKQQQILVEKYKQQLLDNYKKQALFQRLYNAQQMEHQNMDRNISGDLTTNVVGGGNAMGDMAKLDDEQYEAFKRQQQQQQDSLSQQQQNGGQSMRKLSTGSGSSSSSKELQQQQQLAEQFKQMSMQDTLQKRTLAKQESIRQTLAAASTSNDINNNPLSPSSPHHHPPPPGGTQQQNPNSPGGFDPRTLDDLNTIDILVDPRWSGAKQYRGFEEGRDPHRRDNGTDNKFFV